MAKNLNKEEMLAAIRREIKIVFGTKKEAALYFKVTPMRITQVLSGDEKEIAPYLLNFMGYRKVEVEAKYKKEPAI
jgi:hypothetical protein